jgi:hypothetical protein
MYQFNPTGLPNTIAVAFHQSVFQTIDGLTQNVDMQTKAQLMNSLNTNTRVIVDVHTFLFNEAARRGIDLRVLGASLPQNIFEGILYAWTAGALNVIRGGQQQQQQGFNPTIIGGHQAAGSMYSSGSPIHSQPQQTPVVQAQQPAQAPISQVVQSVQPTVTPSIRKDIPVIETLEWHREPSDDETRLDKSHGLSIIDTTWGANLPEPAQARVTLTSFRSRRVEAGPFEAFRDLQQILPDAMKRSYWAHRMLWTMTGHIPIDTHKFLAIRDAVRAIYQEERWRGVLAVLQDQVQGVWQKIDAYLVERLNTALLSKLRLDSNLGALVTLDTTKDLFDLCDPHFNSPLADHPAFTTTLDAIIDRVMSETFIHDTVVLPERHNVTPLMKCRQVEYFKGNTTKYDYGMLPEEERNELIATLFANNTVFMLDRCVLATNTVPVSETHRLLDPEWITSSEHQGIFAKVMERLVDDRLPMPDTVVLTRYRVAPAEWLNLVQPIYPMASKLVYLVGSNRIIGW